MSEPRFWWICKSVSDDTDTMTAYDIDGQNEDWTATKGHYVIEKKAYDKLKAERDELKVKLDIAVEALETITGQYTDMADGDIRDMWAKQAIEALNKIKNDNP